MRIRNLVIVLLSVVVCLPTFVVAQDPRTDDYHGWPISNPKNGYQGYVGGWQTRNIPAGSVQDPGSHLTYIVDTGINARALLKDSGKSNGAAIDPEQTGTVLDDLAAWLDKDGNGHLDDGATYQNFIGIVNWHPTMAVTVHFRYFNDNCDDVLDFLVVLTCRDTLIFDPFNFVIPGSTENTRSRIFGPASTFLDPLATVQFGSGRFVITAAASGTSTDTWDDAEWLFPNELSGLSGKCNIYYESDGTKQLPEGEFELWKTLEGNWFGRKYQNVGIVPGLDKANLHVYNASQISFNYLIGHLTAAVPTAAGQDQVSWGLPAWARPVVERMLDFNPLGIENAPDGDSVHGYHFPGDFVLPWLWFGGLTGRIVEGLEPVMTSETSTTVPEAFVDNNGQGPNTLYLRSDVHGGNIHSGTIHPGKFGGGFSHYGAIASSALHQGWATAADDQWFHYLSVADDYDGSSNAGVVDVPFRDQSANITPAFTTYILQIYDSDEHPLTFATTPPLNVSPPRPGLVIKLKLVCFCLRTFLTENIIAATSVDSVTIREMDNHFNHKVLAAGTGGYRGLLVPDGPDQSGGGICNVRDNNHVVALTAANNEEIGGPFVIDPAVPLVAAGGGTATESEGENAQETPLGPSFLTIVQYVLKFQGFGVSWWEWAVASDAYVADQGHLTPWGFSFPPIPPGP